MLANILQGSQGPFTLRGTVDSCGTKLHDGKLTIRPHDWKNHYKADGNDGPHHAQSPVVEYPPDPPYEDTGNYDGEGNHTWCVVSRLNRRKLIAAKAG